MVQKLKKKGNCIGSELRQRPYQQARRAHGDHNALAGKQTSRPNAAPEISIVTAPRFFTNNRPQARPKMKIPKFYQSDYLQ